MKVIYDPQTDSLTIILREVPVKESDFRSPELPSCVWALKAESYNSIKPPVTEKEEGMVILKPLLYNGDKADSKGKFVIGTVKGDLHDIGKTLVECVLKGAGFEVIDLGIDLPPEKFVEAIKELSFGAPVDVAS